MSEHNINTQAQKGLARFRTPYTSPNPRISISTHNGQVVILLCCSSPDNQQRLRAFPQTANLRATLLNKCASSRPKYKAFQKCVPHPKPKILRANLMQISSFPKPKINLDHFRINVRLQKCPLQNQNNS